ncbi:MAG: ANTAR domain-containing protein [Oscillospiraceae bacterium]|nr:ANTAR domain-containing protein [Oscillospiraceae bacterium]
MSLKERIYSVLVVSASKSFNTSLADMLPESRYYPVITVSSVSSAKRCAVERVFDFIMINSPLPDDSGINFAIDTSLKSGTAVLLLVRSDIHDEIFDKVAEHGVFTMPKPTSKPSMIQALRWLASARERLRKSEKRTLSFEEKMEEIRIVNRAKCLLISELKMSEPNAHHYIQKQAMDRCISCKEVAENIILTYS